MDYIIGDTIRIKITIKDYDGEEVAPASAPVLAIYQLNDTALLTSGVSTLTTGTTAQYYYDWTISTGLAENQRLIAVWAWPNHVKRYPFNVITQLS